MDTITLPLNLSADTVERLYFLAAFRKHGYNRTRLARQLKITPKTVRRRLTLYRRQGYIDKIPKSTATS